MSRFWSIIGLAFISFVLCVAVLPALQGCGIFVTAIQMERSSGDKRQVFQIFNAGVCSWSDTPMWIAEYATQHSGDWVTVHRKTGPYGARENWRWGGVHAGLQVFGESLRVMEAEEDVRMAAAQELLRLMQSDDTQLVWEVMDDALTSMWDRVERGDPLNPKVVSSAFSRAEADQSAREEP